MATLTSPAFVPFTVAALILAGLVAIEVITALLGWSASGMVDHAVGLGDGPDLDLSVDLHADLHAELPGHITPDGIDRASPGDPPGPFASAFDWLNRGRVPLLILIMVMLALFSMSGFVIQSSVGAAAAPLPSSLAALLALGCTLPGTRWISRGIGHLVPRDESYSVTDEEFLGQGVEVTVGPVRAGVVARGKVLDRRGNWHFPRLEPAEPGIEIGEGQTALVVAVRGGVLRVIPSQR